MRKYTKKAKIKMTVQQRHRKTVVLERLQQQLKSGQKTTKKTFDQKEPLTEKDKNRIEKEIQILKGKL